MDLLLFAVNSLIERCIPTDKHLAPAVVDKQQATILINQSGTKEEFMAELNETARMIQEKAEAELQLSVSIGISQPFDVLTKAKTAYAEGSEALKYRLKAENKSIIFYEDLDQKKPSKPIFQSSFSMSCSMPLKQETRRKRINACTRFCKPSSPRTPTRINFKSPSPVF